MRLWLAAALALPAAAAAEVKSTGPAGFEVESRAVVKAPPADVYRALARIGAWWDPAHTYSGDARNLRLEPKAGGCLCETIPAKGATVEHLRVVYAAPGEMLRLQGGLGPLQAEAVAGTLTWRLRPVPGGTEITQTYIVAGYMHAGPQTIAPAVDRVLAEQLGRFAAFVQR